MRTIVLVIAVLAALFCQTACGAAIAVVTPCPPGKEPQTQTLVGLLTVHVICDRVIFEIPLAGLNRDILVNTEFAALSTGTDFVAPGSVVDNRVVRLIRRGSKIHLEDVRYNVVRWTPSGRQNAMGPAVIDPRSGEVISSHAIFWHDVLRLAGADGIRKLVVSLL